MGGKGSGRSPGKPIDNIRKWTPKDRLDLADRERVKLKAERAGLLRADRVIERSINNSVHKDRLLGENGQIAIFSKLKSATASLLFEALDIAAEKLKDREKVTISQATTVIEKAGSLLLRLDSAEQGREALQRATAGGDVAKRAHQLRDIATELLARAEPVDVSPEAEDEAASEDEVEF